MDDHRLNSERTRSYRCPLEALSSHVNASNSSSSKAWRIKSSKLGPPHLIRQHVQCCRWKEIIFLLHNNEQRGLRTRTANSHDRTCRSVAVTGSTNSESTPSKTVCGRAPPLSHNMPTVGTQPGALTRHTRPSHQAHRRHHAIQVQRVRTLPVTGSFLRLFWRQQESSEVEWPTTTGIADEFARFRTHLMNHSYLI